MLASIFGKVTSSLGKTYVFSGLLPAGIFLLWIGAFYTSLGALLQFAQQQLSSSDAWKSVAAAGAAWIALAFLFYAVRTRFFGIFEVVPASKLGRFLLFRRLAKRERAQRNLDKLLWISTACRWLSDWKFDPEKVGRLPPWLLLQSPRKEELLSRSRMGRETVITVERTLGDVFSISVHQVDVIASGIFSLYRLVSDLRWGFANSAVAKEVDNWRAAMGSETVGRVLRFVWDDVLRMVDKAFSEREKFGNGHYVFPTALGDLISALDDYGQDRYGIDTTTMWDRIWWILPKDVKADVSDARLSVETLINLIFALVIASCLIGSTQLASCGFGYSTAGDCLPFRAATWIAASGLLAFMAYGGCCFAMEVLASKIASLVDSYRLAAIAQLGFAPKTVGEELALLTQLKGFFTQAKELDPSLALVTPKSEAKAEKADAKEETSEAVERKSEKSLGEKDPSTEPEASPGEVIFPRKNGQG